VQHAIISTFIVSLFFSFWSRKRYGKRRHMAASECHGRVRIKSYPGKCLLLKSYCGEMFDVCDYTSVWTSVDVYVTCFDG